jgi:hypothetical protein
MNGATRQAISASAYAAVSAVITGAPQPKPATPWEWIELRAASAATQLHGGHPPENVYAFLMDTSSYPTGLGQAPAELRERLLFAYVSTISP